MTKVFGFKTREEALAFVKGVEYVNDSAVAVVCTRANCDGTFGVLVEDEESDDEN